MTEQKTLHQAMLDAVSQTLENMAFTEAKENPDENFKPPEDLMWAYLVVLDPIQGEIRLALSESALIQLTCSIFGLEEAEVTFAHMNDILHELLNTIAGLFMTNLLPENQPFKIGLPEHGKEQPPEIDADTICWNLITSDENPLQVYVNGIAFTKLNN